MSSAKTCKLNQTLANPAKQLLPEEAVTTIKRNDPRQLPNRKMINHKVIPLVPPRMTIRNSLTPTTALEGSSEKHPRRAKTFTSTLRRSVKQRSKSMTMAIAVSVDSVPIMPRIVTILRKTLLETGNSIGVYRHIHLRRKNKKALVEWLSQRWLLATSTKDSFWT
jgi:hypothetical protein